ncbi:MAG TPA: hypothetical protein VMD47_00510 [Candidatus Acidoferrales bacterium]|nr:hypothetical protein [Candidatus Acidoferrales bacterium]
MLVKRGRIGAIVTAFVAATILVSFAHQHDASVASAAPVFGCSFPTHMAASAEQTAWEFFVAANCRSAGKSPLVWENWIEQDQLYTLRPGATVQRFHASLLEQRFRQRHHHPALFAPNTGCNPMNGPPPNVIPNAIICEEVHINPSAAAFIRANQYQARSAQAAAARNHVDIQFPASAVEVKVDWIPATQFTTPFTCSNPPAGVHVETVAGVCYAMAGMHISSKLLKDWLWATFEPQSLLTNPLRCKTFGPCHDAWGAIPAVSGGNFTQMTPLLSRLFASANIPPEFRNYRLDGVQIVFQNPNGSPTYLGNSVIEGENVGMTFNTASCITCHSHSTVKTNGADGISYLNAPVGPRCRTAPGWIERDFVWSMLLGVPPPPRNAPTPPPAPCT